MKHSSTLFATFFLLTHLAAGCSDDAPPTTIEGSLSLELGYAEAGFEFEASTPLLADAAQVSPGCAAGWCRITLDEACEPSGLEVWLERGANGEQGYGFGTFELSVSNESTLVSASVVASAGEVVYTSSESETCFVSDLSSVSANGTASILVDCELGSESNRTALAFADLVLAGCSVE